MQKKFTYMNAYDSADTQLFGYDGGHTVFTDNCNI